MEIWIFIWYLALTFSTGTFLLITCNKSRQPVGSKKKLKPKNDSAARSVKSKRSKDGENIYENINNNNNEVEDKKSSKEHSSKQQPPLRQQPSSEVLSDHRQNKVESDSQPKPQQQERQKQQSKRETKKGFFLSDSNPPVSLTTSVTKYENAGLLLNQGQQQPSSSDGSGKVVKQPRSPAPPQQSASELGVDVDGQENKDKESPYEMLQKDENGADKAAPNKEKSSKKKKKKSKKKKKKEKDSSDDEDSSSEKNKKKKHKKKKKNKDKDDEEDSGKKKSKKHKKKKKEKDEEDSSTKQTSDAPPSLDRAATPDENCGILLGPKAPKYGANYEPGLMTQINDALIEGDNGDADERKIPPQLRKAVPPPRPKAAVPVALQQQPPSSYVKGLPKNNRDIPATAGLVTAIANDERQTAPPRSKVVKTGVAQQLPPPSSGKGLSKRSRTLVTGTEAPFLDETQAPSLQLQTGIERLPSSPSKVKAAHRLVKTPKALSPAEKMPQRSKETQTHRTSQENELKSQKMIDNTTQNPTELVTQSMTETCIPAATQFVTGKAKTEMTAQDISSSQQSMPESKTQNMNTFDLVEVTALSETKSCKTQPSWLTPTKFEPVNKPEKVSPDPGPLKPKVLPRDAKAERITKLGLKRGEEAYPTMNDVVSDWGSEAVKPAGEKNGAPNKNAEGAGSAKQDCAEEVTATSKSKTSVAGAARSIEKKPPPSAVTPDELRELRRKEEEERVRKLRENHPKPKPIKRNTYEEKIAKGFETRHRHEYPTFGDVVSDWESVDEKQPSESEESKKDKHKK